MTARPLIFYEIKSQKTEHSRDGIRQLSFACEDHPDMFCFLWIDPNQKLKHVQLLFGESVLEWKEGQGISCSQTNRIQENEIKIGNGNPAGPWGCVPRGEWQCMPILLLMNA